MLKKFLEGVSIANKYGYKIMTYQAMAKNEKDLKLLLSISDFGFLYWGEKLILLNADQPEDEILFTLWHEIGHLVLHSDNEDAADDYARKMLKVGGAA